MSSKSPAIKFSIFLLVVSTFLLGLSMVLMGGHNAISTVINFYGLDDYITSDLGAQAAGVAFLFCGLFAALGLQQEKWLKTLGVLLIIISLAPLITLISSGRWIGSLGGFPAIGSGQGIIKYFSLLAIGIIFFMPSLSNRTKVWLSAIPMAMVLYWIGGMKFTEIEANGIKRLIETSPFMSWMYDIWDVQMTSNLIGFYDIITASLVLWGIFKRERTLLLIGSVMAMAVFIMTQSFFITLPSGAISNETILGGSGHFLIKDLWYIINVIMIWHYIDLKRA